MKKIVLAYSGGLDTSIILKWLQENYKAEVIAYTSDIGQVMDKQKIIKNAKNLGVKKITAIGYDLSDSKIKKVSDHKHFFGDTGELINRGDVLGWEMGANIEASESAYEWLKNKGIDFELASSKSFLSDVIPRVKI